MNERIRRMVVVSAFVMVSASPVLADEASGSDEISSFARGAKLYNDNCSRCHNPRSPSEYSDREWPLIVTHMRVIGGLPGDQARAIETFLRASNNPPALQGAEADKGQRGAALEASDASGDEAAQTSLLDGMTLVQRYGCKGCHVVGGQGGEIGPNLDTVFDRRDEAYVYEHIRQPKSHNPASVMPALGLSEPEIKAILSALRAAH